MTSVTDADRGLLYELAINLECGRSRIEREQLVAAHRQAGMIEGARLMQEAAAKFLEAETQYWPDPAFGALLVYTKQIRALDPAAIVKGMSDGID